VHDPIYLSDRLLIRRSQVRALVGEPSYLRPAAMRAVSFCSAIPALLRKNVDNLISAIDC